jgi:hypothetical protein
VERLSVEDVVKRGPIWGGNCRSRGKPSPRSGLTRV